MAFGWLGGCGWQLCFVVWQGVRAPAGRASVDREEGPLGGRTGGSRLLLAMVDRLVIAQAVQTGVHASAYVTDRLAGRPHVYVLNVPFEPGQRRQALVTRVTSVIFLGGAGATWSQHKQLAPSKLRTHF